MSTFSTGFSFPIAFSTSCLSVVLSSNSSNNINNANEGVYNITNSTLTGFTYSYITLVANGANETIGIDFIALGY